MAKLLSEAGEMQINIREIECEGNAVVMIGQIGVWKSRVVFPVNEIWELWPRAPKLKIIRLMLGGAWKSFLRR